jgi:hypothetical protein
MYSAVLLDLSALPVMGPRPGARIASEARAQRVLAANISPGLAATRKHYPPTGF